MTLKLLSALIVLVMIGLSFSPLNFSIFYILFRPLVQPYAMEHHTLFAGVPLTGIFALVLITYSIIICIFRKGYTVSAPDGFFLYSLLLFSVFSFLNTLDYVLSVAYLLKILTAVALYNLVYSAIKTTSDARKVLYSMVFTSVIPMLVGYYQFFAATGVRGLEGILNRVQGTLGMANAYGIFLSLCFCAVLILILHNKSRSLLRKLLIAALISIVASSIIALNRGTWIALTLALLLASLCYWKHVKVRWLVVAGLSIAIVFSGLIVQRFRQLEEKEPWQQSNTLAKRIEMWKAVIELVPTHPIIGFGIGNAKRLGGVPHNDYVRFLLEIGFPGALLYTLFLLRELYRNIRLTFDKTNWFVNFPILICVIYWIIISSVQNIVYHVVNFPMFLALIAVSRKWNELSYNSRNGQS